MITELKCTNCSAMLVADADGKTAECKYCGAVFLLGTPEIAPTPIEIPEITPTPIETPEIAPTPTPKLDAKPLLRRLTSNAEFYAFLLLLAFVGAMLLIHFCNNRQAGVGGSWRSNICLVDANGDNALDFAALRAGSDGWDLNLIDGATGKLLWSGQRYALDSKFICLSPTHFGIDDINLLVHLFPAKNPNTSLEFDLSDRLEEAEMGHGCLKFNQINDKETYFSLTGAPISSCETDELTENREILWSTSPGYIVTDKLSYRLTVRSPGTPFLIASASLDGITLWSIELPVVRADRGYAMIYTPNMLVIWGALLNNTSYAVILGLDPQTGVVRYMQTQDSRESRELLNFTYNGRYVIAVWGPGLHAYDPMTGNRIWDVGSTVSW